MPHTIRFLSVALMFSFAACDSPSGQNGYDSRDVGKNTPILYGTVISERQVQIKDQDTGTGALAGGVGGGVLGSLIGAGNGSVLGALGGAIAGLFVGNEVEKNLGNHTGIEYIIHFDDGGNQSIVQNIAPGDVPINVNQRVMIQMQGTYRRVLPIAPPAAPPAPMPSAPVTP